jgi:putative ABC transport system permease protein
MIDLAYKSLLHDKLRFVITASGVAFAVTLVFVQAGLFLGLLSNAVVTIEHLPADLWVTSRNTPNVDFARLFPENLVQRVRSVPGVERADNLMVMFLQVALPSGSQETTVTYALENFTAWSFPWSIIEGNPADLRRGPFLFLDDSARKRFGPFAIGDRREVQGRRMTIIGRTQGAYSFTTTPISFMAYEQAQSMFDETSYGKTSYILVKARAGADIAAIQQELRRRLPHNDVFTKDEWSSQSWRYWVESTGLGLNMMITICLGVLVGVVVVAQTLYTSTMENLKQFGTVKAIGGSNLDIYKILAKQAVIAATIGSIAGALMAWALQPAIALLDMKLIIPPQLTIVVFAGAQLLCLAAAIISFRRVARIDPALVFRA